MNNLNKREQNELARSAERKNCRTKSNKINSLFAHRGDKKLLSLYFCAGAPTLNGTGDVILTMQQRGISMIEVGIPFSDPMADGPVIQDAATTALKNGMTLFRLVILWPTVLLFRMQQQQL